MDSLFACYSVLLTYLTLPQPNNMCLAMNGLADFVLDEHGSTADEADDEGC
jgi:hypothetical protein